MSDFSDVVDAVASELETNVATLAAMSLVVHKYEPWDPEDLAAGPGESHLAVWPVAENAEVAGPLVTAPGGDEIEQLYRIVYWEHIGTEGGDTARDETASAALLQLQNDIRARFYVTANLQLGGTTATRYRGTVMPNRAGGVRWFAMTIACTSHVLVT